MLKTPSNSNKSLKKGITGGKKKKKSKKKEINNIFNFLDIFSNYFIKFFLKDFICKNIKIENLKKSIFKLIIFVKHIKIFKNGFR